MVLWDLLERALDLSTEANVMDHMDEVLHLCEAAVAHLREAPSPSPRTR